MLVKTLLRHNVFEINAGLSRRSWRFIQRINTEISASVSEIREILMGERRPAVRPVIDL